MMEHLKLYEEFEFNPKKWFKKRGTEKGDFSKGIDIRDYKDDIDDILLDLKDMSFASTYRFNMLHKNKKRTLYGLANLANNLVVPNAIDYMFFVEGIYLPPAPRQLNYEVKEEIEVIIKRVKDLNISVEHDIRIEYDVNKGGMCVIYFVFNVVDKELDNRNFNQFYDTMLFKARTDPEMDIWLEEDECWEEEDECWEEEDDEDDEGGAWENR